MEQPRKSLATNSKEFAEVQALMERIVHLNTRQLHLLTWRLHELFRERKFVPQLLTMLEQNPPQFRNAIEEATKFFEQAQPMIDQIFLARRGKKKSK